MKEIYLGLDFGNETCCISQDHDTQNISSYILFGAKNRMIGNDAQSLFISSMENTVYNFKRFLGATLSDPEIEKEKHHVTYKVCNTSDCNIGVKVTYLNDERIFTITQIAAMLLTKLKKTAESHFKGRVSKCVIAVPSYFTNAARLAVWDSAKIAKFDDVELINETTAVAFLYRFNNKNSFTNQTDFQKIVIVDMGQSSLQVSACRISKDNIDILATATCLSTGGRDIDATLANHFINEFRRKNNFTGDVSTESYRRLLTECKKLKHYLSDNTSHTMPIIVDSFVNNERLSSNLDKKRLDILCTDLRTKIEDTMQAALSRSGLNPNDIDYIELVGGSTRVPFIKDIARHTFGKDPNSRLGNDVAVAKGCSLRCSALSSNECVSIRDRLVYPIALCWPTPCFNNLNKQQLFHVKESFPISKVCVVPSATNIHAHYCDSKEMPSNGNFIGCYNATVDPNKNVMMQFDINASGILSRTKASIVDGKKENSKIIEEVSPACWYSAEPVLPKQKLHQFIEEQTALNYNDDAEEARLEAKNFLETFCYTWRKALSELDCQEFPFVKEYVLWTVNTVVENLCGRNGRYRDLLMEEYDDLTSGFQEKYGLLNDFVKVMKDPCDTSTLRQMRKCMIDILNGICSTRKNDDDCMKNFEVLFTVLKKYNVFMKRIKSGMTNNEVLSQVKVLVQDIDVSLQKKVKPSQQAETCPKKVVPEN